MKTKYESFKIEVALMNMVRKVAIRDQRTIKAVISMALREKFLRDKTKEKI